MHTVMRRNPILKRVLNTIKRVDQLIEDYFNESGYAAMLKFS